MKAIFLILSFLISSIPAFSAGMTKMSEMEDMEMAGFSNGNIQRASDCGSMEVFDIGMGMCMPLPMAGMPMKMLMIHGNAFAVVDHESGPRGRNSISGPDMFMADLGTTLGNNQYINLDFMGTLEKWTTPNQGYPELLQIGEENNQGVPFIDAQHPHSSPIMGLTLSDTISFAHNKDHIKLFFAPRGEATDGPIAFMHRITGMINPDAPLSHHVGQDVGHITSTVLGESLKLGDTHFELSTYNGTGPKPEKVDLPIGSFNSYSARVIEDFSPSVMAMASFAYVKNPELDDLSIHLERRYSASVYNFVPISDSWSFDNTFIFGHIQNLDSADDLSSFTEEFLFMGERPRIWGRLEVLQRTTKELQIAPVNANDRSWVTALTLGYTHKLLAWDDAELSAGASITHDFLPNSFAPSYGGNPWAGKVFIQFGGMKMWDL